MILLDGSMRSRTLGFPLSYTVAMPDKTVKGERVPPVLLLHNLGEGRSDLIHSMALSPLVQKSGVALIIPEGRRSCFLNMTHGPKWNDLLRCELISRLRDELPLAAGALSVIGYGAGCLGALQLARDPSIRCALINPIYIGLLKRNGDIWPVEAEWKGVFEDTQEQWEKKLFKETRGLLSGCAEQIRAVRETFDLNGWTDCLSDQEDRQQQTLQILHHWANEPIFPVKST